MFRQKGKFQSIAITVNPRNEARWANRFRQTGYKVTLVETDAVVKKLTSLDGKRSATLVDKQYLQQSWVPGSVVKARPLALSRPLPHGYR